jgi:hypothetical protein
MLPNLISQLEELIEQSKETPLFIEFFAVRLLLAFQCEYATHVVSPSCFPVSYAFHSRGVAIAKKLSPRLSSWLKWPPISKWSRWTPSLSPTSALRGTLMSPRTPLLCLCVLAKDRSRRDRTVAHSYTSMLSFPDYFLRISSLSCVFISMADG